MNPNLNYLSSVVSMLMGASAAKRSNVVSIDLGQRATKAVHVERTGNGLRLLDYVVHDAPAFDQAPTPEMLGTHLKQITEAINYRGKHICAVLGVSDVLVRNAELPAVPVGDMRLMLKYNSKSYLQQELQDYVFDCHTLGLQQLEGDGGPRTTQKARVLVGGAKRQTLDHVQQAAKHAGLILEQAVPYLICPANAFEAAMPEVFAKETVALVDVGFKSSSISIRANGELSLNRVVGLGADKLTAGLAEAMGVSYAEAEGIKVGLPEEVQGAMQGLITPLGRDLRASIDFFEHQQDKAVSQVFVSGGSARSQFIVESLQGELMVQTKTWSPLTFMGMALTPEKLAEIEQVASQLAVAVGGALAAL